ncbi:15305_t:CDS:2, partial [Gigaspora margarita]
LSINIVMLYVAPTSSEVQKNIKEYLKKYLKDIETKKKAQRCMILGDFNAHSRIDTIWVDCHWKQSIIFCKTKNMDLRTEYRANLSKELKRKLSKDIRKKNAQKDILDYQLLESKTLDKLWDIIESSIKKSATNTLSQKKKTRVVEDIAYTDAVEELEHFIEPLKTR